MKTYQKTHDEREENKITQEGMKTVNKQFIKITRTKNK